LDNHHIHYCIKCFDSKNVVVASSDAEIYSVVQGDITNNKQKKKNIYIYIYIYIPTHVYFVTLSVCLSWTLTTIISGLAKKNGLNFRHFCTAQTKQNGDISIKRLRLKLFFFVFDKQNSNLDNFGPFDNLFLFPKHSFCAEIYIIFLGKARKLKIVILTNFD
jgi:hypothetical protein